MMIFVTTTDALADEKLYEIITSDKEREKIRLIR